MCEISKKIIKMQGTPGTGYSGKIKIKMAALSVNQAWQGRRFKTPEYKRYERDLLLLLPCISIPKNKLKLTLVIGFKNTLSDIDNIAKPLIDILQKKYKFNDKQIYELHLFKVITDKPFIDIDIAGLY
jgi:Holliday junction resolvase RusA-like endonuclease